MAFVTMVLLAFGVVLSSVSGLVCYMGSSSLNGLMDWMPYSDTLLSHPEMALALGAVLTIACALGPPSRVE